MNELAKEILRNSEKAVVSLRERSRDKLDYSESSLGVVEEILAEAAGYRSELPEHVVTGLVQELGSYVLMVGHRLYGGSFYWLEATKEPVLVVGEPQRHIAIAAWGKVRGRLDGDAADHIPFFFRGFAERVASSEPGTRALYV